MALGHAPLSVLPLSTLPGASGPAAYTLTASSAAFVITGTAANLEWGHKLAAASASFVITGGAAGLEVGREVVAGSAAFTITTGAAGLRATRKLVAGSAAFTITGTAAGLEAGRRLVAGSAAFTISGSAASLEAGRKLLAESAAWVITGSDATLTYTPVDVSDTTTLGGLGLKQRREDYERREIVRPVISDDDAAKLREFLDAQTRKDEARDAPAPVLFTAAELDWMIKALEADIAAGRANDEALALLLIFTEAVHV